MRPVLTDEEVARSRAEVCRVAEGLFASHGVEGVTMRQIAAELGWSSTTAYRYFKSKEEILAAVRAAAFNRFCDVIEQATRSSADPRKSARTVGQAYIGFALKNSDAYRMMFDVDQSDVTGNPELTEALARAHRAMIAYVTPLIELGILDGDAKALGQMLWAAAHGLVMLRLSGIVSGDAALRKLHEQTMSALARGTHQVAPAPSRARKTPVALPRLAARKTARSPPRNP
ncbi:MAG: Transcriptional regulator, TetR family [Ramlibacter sp.]|jgi:AcrR family transcriptional regulator|nr:Transcriptional regulator, TetR family [Ramlibacter sp.]MCE3269740.1 Transcriptional regulator, TetR family [Ramlibacter sp.]